MSSMQEGDHLPEVRAVCVLLRRFHSKRIKDKMTCDYCGAKDDTHGWKQCLANVQAERGQVQLHLDIANLQIAALKEAGQHDRTLWIAVEKEKDAALLQINEAKQALERLLKGIGSDEEFTWGDCNRIVEAILKKFNHASTGTSRKQS